MEHDTAEGKFKQEQSLPEVRSQAFVQEDFVKLVSGPGRTRLKMTSLFMMFAMISASVSTEHSGKIHLAMNVLSLNAFCFLLLFRP